MRPTRLLRDASWSVGLRVSSMGLGFLTTVLLARSLGTAGYGTYSYALALVTLLSLPAQAGLPTLLMRETARNTSLGRPDLVRGIWGWASKATSVLSILVIAIGGVWLLATSGTRTSLEEWTLVWAFLLVPFAALGNLRGAALMGLDRVTLGQLPEFVLRPALLFAFLASLSLVADNFTASGAMFSHLLAAAISFGIGALLLWRNTPSAIATTQPAYEKQQWIASFWPLALIMGMMTVTGYADILILGFVTTPEDVGVYRVSVQMGALVAFGLTAVNMVVAPRFARLHAVGDAAGLQALVTRSARMAFAVSLGVGLTFGIFGRQILTTAFGEDFAAAYVPMLILIGGYMLSSFAGSVGYLLNMTGHERDEARIVTIAAAVNIAINILLIPVWGPSGAAVASATSLALWRLWLARRVRLRLGVNSYAIQFGKRRVR